MPASVTCHCDNSCLLTRLQTGNRLINKETQAPFYQTNDKYTIIIILKKLIYRKIKKK